MTNEELDKLEAAIKQAEHRIKWKDAHEDFVFMELFNAARAHLAAQRQAPAETPLKYFSKNIDGRKTIDVFESACRAIKKADEATVSGDEVQHEIWFNIFKCESMRLMREYEEAPNIRAALTNSVPQEVVEKVYDALDKMQLYVRNDGVWINFRAKGSCLIRMHSLSEQEHNCIEESGKLREEALRELEPYIKKDENK